MSLSLTALGGVGRFGKNALLVTCDGVSIVIDCGARFLGDEAPGFDIALPQPTLFAALGDTLLAYVVTHGHEDHIGALPFAAQANPRPIITTPYTARLVARRFDRAGVRLPDVKAVPYRAPLQLGPFSITFVAVSHSVPDASALIVRTPHGSFVHSGDFRIDDDPVLGPPTDMEALTMAGDEGIDVLLADSTGANIPGKNAGERSVYAPLLAAVADAPKNVVVAQFASHIQRLKLVADVAKATGRKMALLGAGLVEHHRIARDLRLLELDGVLEKDIHLKQRPLHEQLWVVTGTQAERGSGLFRLAQGESPIPLEQDTRLVMSARVIPGNEVRVHTLLDALAERGVNIVDGHKAPHVSGHGTRDDLEGLLYASRPKHFVALHGDARHLLAHGALVHGCGLTGAHIHALRDGHTAVLAHGEMTLLPGVSTPTEAFANHKDVCAEPLPLVAVRKRMAQGGVLFFAGDRPVFRGVFPLPSGELLADIEATLREAWPLAGTPDEGEACLKVARHFYRAGRAAPEIVLFRP